MTSGLLQYTYQARRLADEVEPDHDVVFADCDCREGAPLADGRLPEYFDTYLPALRRYFRHRLLGVKYFAVHVRDPLRPRHILHVHSRLASQCPVCSSGARDFARAAT